MLLSASEVAERLGVSVSAVYRRVRMGQLQAHRVGRVLCFLPEEMGWCQEEAGDVGEAPQTQMHRAVIRLRGVLRLLEEIQHTWEHRIHREEVDQVARVFARLNDPACGNVLDELYGLLQTLEHAKHTGPEAPLHRQVRLTLRRCFEGLRTVFGLEPFGMEQATMILSVQQLASYRLLGPHGLGSSDTEGTFEIVHPGWRIGDRIVAYPMLAGLTEQRGEDGEVLVTEVQRPAP